MLSSVSLDHTSARAPRTDGCYTTLIVQLEANFFAHFDALTASTLTWTIFASGQLARPVGGLIFGYFGDRPGVGRRPVIIAATACMCTATGVIGMLPTSRCCGSGWADVGVGLLCLCRLLQGIGAAGSVGSAYPWVVETVAKERMGFASGIVACQGVFGYLIASGVTDLVSAIVGKEAMLDWGWRLTFLFGLPLGLTSMCWQLKAVDESKEFLSAAAPSSAEHGAAPPPSRSNALALVWAGYKLEVCCSHLAHASCSSIPHPNPHPSSQAPTAYGCVTHDLLISS